MRYSVLPLDRSADVRPFVVGVLEEMVAFYLDDFDRRVAGLVLGDLVNNAFAHGPGGTETMVEFGLFLGDTGVCYAVRDGGDYFKRQDIKEQYESKTSITVFDDSHGHGCHVGVNNNIFPNADIIEVNTETGTLYCAQLLTRLIKKP